MKCTHLKTLLAIASLLTAASAACADVMTFDGVGLASNVTLHADGMLGDGLNVRAGEYLYTYQDVHYRSFCVDIDHYAGTSEVVERDIDWLPNGALVAFLYETYAGTLQNGTEAAALGVAIWEMVYEDEEPTFDVTSGYFSITGNEAVAAAANGLLATLPDSYSPETILKILDSPDKQDMVIGTGVEVPEPATLSLVSLAALPLLRRKRK